MSKPLTTKRTYLQSAAMSYANVSNIQMSCYQYIINAEYDRQSVLSAYYTEQLQSQDIKPKHIDLVVTVALAELTYPTHNTTKYAWSGNERAECANMTPSTWHRNNLCFYVNFIIDDMRSKAHHTWVAVRSQLIDA